MCLRRLGLVWSPWLLVLSLFFSFEDFLITFLSVGFCLVDTLFDYDFGIRGVKLFNFLVGLIGHGSDVFLGVSNDSVKVVR